MSDLRPKWKFLGMTEAEFRQVCKAGMVTQITAKWAFTSVDTTREWLEVTNFDGNKSTLPNNWRQALEFIGYSSAPASSS